MEEASSVTTMAVLVMAGIVLIQTLAIATVNLVLQRKLRRAEPKLMQSTHKALDLLHRGEEWLDRVEPIRGKLPVWGEIVAGKVSQFTASLAAMDDTAERLISGLREQVREADRRTDQLLLGFAQKAAQVQQLVSHPAHHVSALVLGARAALGRYFASDDDNTPYDFHSDLDDSFI